MRMQRRSRTGAGRRSIRAAAHEPVLRAAAGAGRRSGAGNGSRTVAGPDRHPSVGSGISVMNSPAAGSLDATRYTLRVDEATLVVPCVSFVLCLDKTDQTGLLEF